MFNCSGEKLSVEQQITCQNFVVNYTGIFACDGFDRGDFIAVQHSTGKKKKIRVQRIQNISNGSCVVLRFVSCGRR